MSNIWDKEYGFSTFNGAEAVRQIETTKIVKEEDLIGKTEQEVIAEKFDEMVNELASEIYTQKLPRVEAYKNPMTRDITITAEMMVAPSGIKMINVENTTFKCDGEDFTETEIAKAVKAAFPERFI